MYAKRNIFRGAKEQQTAVTKSEKIFPVSDFSRNIITLVKDLFNFTRIFAQRGV